MENKNQKLNYQQLLKNYPWIVQKNQNCVLSPDSDGFLCGLFMSHYLNWKIVGFYDGKILIIKKGLKPKDCVFLDMEIFRNEVKSIGHHMLSYNNNRLPNNWEHFKNCISANNLRGFDMKHNFSAKYPFGTIHLLLGIVGYVRKIDLPIESLCPLLYTDGTFKNLFNYPDNCLGWLDFLSAEFENTPLNNLFFNEHYSISRLMIALNSLFSELRKINNEKRGGDKIKISDKNGNLTNFDKTKQSLNQEVITKARQFLKLLEQKTNWKYLEQNWHWKQFEIIKFQKEIIKPSQGRFNDLLIKKPLSWAITSGNTLEYTLDNKDLFSK